MGVASLRAMIELLDSLYREDSPGIHTLHPTVLSNIRIEKCQLLRHEYKQVRDYRHT